MVIGGIGVIGDDKGMKMADAMAVVAGRSIRPCDVCGRKKSRLYCAADDAYLCEPCDSSVHAANTLSMRHARVRLAPNGAPMKVDRRSSINPSDVHMHGQFRKKAKTKAGGGAGHRSVAAREAAGFVVPSVDPHGVKMEFPGSFFDGDGEFTDDHFTAEDFIGGANFSDSQQPGYSIADSDFAQKFFLPNSNDSSFSKHDRFRTDHVKSFGGRQCEEDMIGVVPTDTGMVAQKWMTQLSQSGRVGNGNIYAVDTTAMRGSTEPNEKRISGYGDAVALPGAKGGKAGLKTSTAQPDWVKLEDIYEEAARNTVDKHSFNPCDSEGLKGRKDYNAALVPSLRLDIEDVMSSWQDRAWMSQGQGTDSAGGNDDPSSSSLGVASDEGRVPSALGRSGSGGEDSARSSENARKEKVSRYMEKRKTRLHHNNGKMIRYQVRKINAERRPRDKGRFVKRSPGGE